MSPAPCALRAAAKGGDGELMPAVQGAENRFPSSSLSPESGITLTPLVLLKMLGPGCSSVVEGPRKRIRKPKPKKKGCVKTIHPHLSLQPLLTYLTLCST